MIEAWYSGLRVGHKEPAWKAYLDHVMCLCKVRGGKQGRAAMEQINKEKADLHL